MKKLDAGLPLSCTLSDAEFRKRRADARKYLVPKITRIERIENGVIFHFNPERELADGLASFIELERQCCKHLTLTPITARTSDDPIGLRVEGPAQAAATIEMFVQAATQQPNHLQ